MEQQIKYWKDKYETEKMKTEDLQTKVNESYGHLVREAYRIKEEYGNGNGNGHKRREI